MVKVGDRVRVNPTVEEPVMGLGDVGWGPWEVGTVTEIEGEEIWVKFRVDGVLWRWGRAQIAEMEVEVAPGRWVRARAPLLAGARARAGAQERQ